MFSSNTSQVEGGYQISRSLRFNSADSASLSRTPASASNRKTWTWSAWVKRAALVTTNIPQNLFGARNGSGLPYTLLRFDDGTTSTGYGLVFQDDNNNIVIRTTAQYRDVSAWYHIVLACDTTQATASNRVRIYVNNVEVTSFSSVTYPTQNYDMAVNSTYEHRIGAQPAYGDHFNGYMTEVNFIDGQALTPSSFGETNAQTGVWQPKAYSGSYGTNGFYLNFSDNSNTTAATLGKDYSGNGNNWTPNNFSVASGVGNDSLVDTPTPYGSDSGAGGSVRGNYATLNPLNATPSALISNGNLYALSNLSGHFTSAPATIFVNSGKWYAEVVFSRVAGSIDSYYVGIADAAWQASQIDNGGWYGRWWRDGTGYAYGDTGNKITGTTSSSYGATYTQGDVMGIALDMDAGTLTFYKNGTSQGVAFTGITGTKTMVAGAYKDASITLAFDINLGQRAFAYTAPSGFKALCTQNLPTPTIGATTATQAGKYFNPVLYTGNASTNNITGVGFQPDFVWIKQRDVLRSHGLYDAVRGVLKDLQSDRTDAEVNYSGSLTSFNSDGFSLGSATDPNASGGSFVAWNWKANGSGSTNTAGSITSTVSANTTSGFSVVTWTGTGIPVSIGHGLGATPKMVITKNRDNTWNWFTYHEGAGASYYLELNTTVARNLDTSVWQNTAPTSSVFTIGAGINANGAKFVAYCFAEVPGYSRFGSYTGNGSSDGPFVYCGFRPKYVLVKQTDISRNWWVFDGARNPSNVVTYYLAPDLSDAENTFNVLDFTSNGFKWRDSSGGWNQNGGTYIFMAFAENPFKYALAR